MLQAWQAEAWRTVSGGHGARIQELPKVSFTDGEIEALRGSQAQFLAFSLKGSCFLYSWFKPSEYGTKFLNPDIMAETESHVQDSFVSVLALFSLLLPLPSPSLFASCFLPLTSFLSFLLV